MPGDRNQVIHQDDRGAEEETNSSKWSRHPEGHDNGRSQQKRCYCPALHKLTPASGSVSDGTAAGKGYVTILQSKKLATASLVWRVFSYWHGGRGRTTEGYC